MRLLSTLLILVGLAACAGPRKTLVHSPRVPTRLTDDDYKAAAQRLLKTAITAPNSPGIEEVNVTSVEVGPKNTKIKGWKHGLLGLNTEAAHTLEHDQVADFRVVEAGRWASLELLDKSGGVFAIIYTGLDKTSAARALADFYAAACPLVRAKYLHTDAMDVLQNQK
jgi:hypothetical protein